MLIYPNLISPKYVGGFWQSLLERLSVAEAPYLGSITGGRFYLDQDKNGIQLADAGPDDVISYCSGIWNISCSPVRTWKDVRKESVRVLLLKRYVEENYKPNDWQCALLKLHLQIATKQIKADQIHLKSTFDIDRIE